MTTTITHTATTTSQTASLDPISAASADKPRDFQTQLQYVKVSEDGKALGPSTWGKTDYEQDREQLVPVTIHDARGRQADFNLDKHGFQLIKYPTIMKKEDYMNEENIKNIYYPEVEQMVKDTWVYYTAGTTPG